MGDMHPLNPVMKTRDLCAQVLRYRGLPLENRAVGIPPGLAASHH